MLGKVSRRAYQSERSMWALHADVEGNRGQAVASALAGVTLERITVSRMQFGLVLAMTLFGGFLGGLLGGRWTTAIPAGAEKPNTVNAQEFLLVDTAGKARAGLGLDANGEVGLILTSRDGSRTLTLTPDERTVIKLTERGGRVLWGVP